MNETFNKLIELTNKKEKLILKIFEATVDQESALKLKDTQKLNEVTDLKQGLIDEFDKINDEFQALYKIFVEKNSQHSNDYFAVLSQKINNIFQVMEKINELELKNKDNLIQQMNEIKKNIKSANTTRKGFNAYFQRGIQGGSYIDEKN